MVKNKLSQLRSLFQESNINGYILSTQDEYLSEYPPACSKRLEYLSGFSGSNGLVIILENTILFFTDGRYFTQATQELDSNLFQIFDQKLLVNFTWENYIHKVQRKGGREWRKFWFRAKAELGVFSMSQYAGIVLF